MEVILLVLVLLLLAAIFAVLWMARGRIHAMEAKLRELSSLAFLPDRVQALAKELEALAVDDVRAELEQLHKDLVRLEDVVAVPFVGSSEPPSREQMVRALVTRFLRDEGYSSVVIDDAESELDADLSTVLVTAMKHGARIHGSVIVEGNTIGAVDLEPSYTSFP